MSDRITIGISSCLLGNAVRYDGGHKRTDAVVLPLENEFELLAVCPEVECGLPVPRPAMRLVDVRGEIRLAEIAAGTDHTCRMAEWTGRRLRELETAGIAGFVFKARSPSCGVNDAEIVDGRGEPCGKRAGVFAEEFRARFPDLPVEDEELLADRDALRSFVLLVKQRQR